MRVCFVCCEYPPVRHGGIGSFIQGIGRALVAAGHEVRVIGLYSADAVGESSRTEPEFDQGVEVWRLRVPRGPLGGLHGRRVLFLRIAEWVREGIELIEVPDYQGLAAHWPRLQAPVLTRLHGSATYFAAEMGRRFGRFGQYLEKRSLHRSDFWCSVSRYTARRTKILFDLRSEPSAILANGVDVPEPTPWSARHETKVVFTGTLTQKKGVIALIDAWPHVARVFPDARLYLFGKDGIAPSGGSMMSYLRQRISDASMARVHFAGHVPRKQVLAELQSARVAVFPSYAEAFALAPLESMAAGCPTVGSSLGSGPELISDGIDGLTVDPGDPRQIALALSCLLADEPLSRQLAEKGRAKVADRFSLRATLPANVDFFADCVERHKAFVGRGARAEVASASAR